MYLKSIELYGFKSFADRTKIEFNDSLTCIVGPNGSGKSNITDAIKWALGEQSTMALRGAKMSDVIFSGSENRRPLGFAEVILTFDNTTKYVDLDYDTIEIKRKLYKNGDSEYYINNSSCRLKDIRKLFMDTGIGKDGYSIIGQGKIDDILNSKPTERKLIFEEASGISKYKSEKEDTQKKLKKVKENAVRLSDLIYEINLQKEDLQEEAKVAEKYLEVFEGIKEKDIALSTFDLKNLKITTKKIRGEVEETESKKIEVEKEQKKLEFEQRETQKKLELAESNINELQALNVENVKKEKDLRNTINLNNEKIISSKNATIEYRARIDILENELIKSKDEAEKIEEKIASTESLLKQETEAEKIIRTRLLGLNESKNMLKDEIDNKNMDLSNLKNIILENEINSKNFSEKIKSIEDNLEENNKQLSLLKTKYISTIEDIKKLDGHIANKKNLVKQEKLTLERLEKENLKLEEKTRLLVEDNSFIKGEVNSKTVKLNTLENMEENYEGYNRTIKNFFNYISKNKIEFNGLIDTVGNILEVDKKYEKAITTSLGGAVQNIVVREFSVAKEIISFLKKHNMGRITFLPMEDLKVYTSKFKVESPGYIGRASNLVKYESQYKKIVDFLLGNIYVVDNLDNANKLSRQKNFNNRIVTLDGEIIYPGGSVTGGSMQVKGNILNRKNEIKAIRKDLQKLEEKLIENEKSLSKLKLEKSESQSEIQAKYTAAKKIEEELLDLENQLFQTKLIRDNSKASLNDIEDYISLDKEKLSNFTSNASGLQGNLLDSSKKLDKLNKILVEMNLDLLEKENKIAESNNELQSIEIKKSRYTSDISYLKKDLDRILMDRQNKSQEIKDLEVKVHKTLELSELLMIENEREELDLNDLEEINASFYEKNQELQDQRKEILTAFNKFNDDINSLRNKSFEYEKQLLDLNNKLEKTINRKSDIIDSLGENYFFTPVSNDLKLDKKTVDEFRQVVKKGKQKLKSYGNVNLESINRYESILERYNFNKKQYDDLIETKENLNRILADIEEVMEEKFMNSIKIINSKFNDIFSYMFNGGSAEIVLTDGENLEEIGVDILAQLPGKNRQPLSALSGGERSMTAVSLLFAFLETRPAPFCLLDEVDAALDEANIYRFTSYLKTLDNIQFAIITHRKATMESSQAIYGVTMDDPGISKVVSLKFEEGGNYA